jgi:hypothetical protein
MRFVTGDKDAAASAEKFGGRGTKNKLFAAEI